MNNRRDFRSGMTWGQWRIPQLSPAYHNSKSLRAPKYTVSRLRVGFGSINIEQVDMARKRNMYRIPRSSAKAVKSHHKALNPLANSANSNDWIPERSTAKAYASKRGQTPKPSKYTKKQSPNTILTDATLKKQLNAKRRAYHGTTNIGAYVPSGTVRRRQRPLSAPATRKNKTLFLFSHHGSIAASSTTAFPTRKIIVRRPRPQTATIRNSDSGLRLGNFPKRSDGEASKSARERPSRTRQTIIQAPSATSTNTGNRLTLDLHLPKDLNAEGSQIHEDATIQPWGSYDDSIISPKSKFQTSQTIVKENTPLSAEEPESTSYVVGVSYTRSSKSKTIHRRPKSARQTRRKRSGSKKKQRRPKTASRMRRKNRP